MKNLYEGKHNICDYHDAIKELARKIENIRIRDYDDISDLLNDVQWIASDIYTYADKALDSGQSMENRLREYRDAIECIGFIRNK